MPKIRVMLQQDPELKGWTIWCPILPGCISEGDTKEEALNNIKEAIDLWLVPDENFLDIDEFPLGAILDEIEYKFL